MRAPDFSSRGSSPSTRTASTSPPSPAALLSGNIPGESTDRSNQNQGKSKLEYGFRNAMLLMMEKDKVYPMTRACHLVTKELFHVPILNAKKYTKTVIVSLVIKSYINKRKTKYVKQGEQVIEKIETFFRQNVKKEINLIICKTCGYSLVPEKLHRMKEHIETHIDG